MTTALQLITSSLRLIQAVRKTESITADEAEDGLAALNEMLGSWSNNGLNIVSRSWESFSITAGTSFTIGLGQTFNTVRPTDIKSIFIRSGNIDYSLDPLTDEEYEQITIKNITTNIPQFYNYDNGYPVGIIRLYPAYSGGGELHLLSEKPLTEFSALTDTINLPAGTLRAIKYNLAIDLAPEYGKEVSPIIYEVAKKSLGQIRLAVAKNRPIKQRYYGNIGNNNIYTGWYR